MPGRCRELLRTHRAQHTHIKCECTRPGDLSTSAPLHLLMLESISKLKLRKTSNAVRTGTERCQRVCIKLPFAQINR